MVEIIVSLIVGVVIGFVICYFVMRNNPKLESDLKTKYDVVQKDLQDEINRLKAKLGL